MKHLKMPLVLLTLCSSLFASLFFYDEVKKKGFRNNPADSGSTNYQGYSTANRDQQLFLLNGAAISNGTTSTASVSNFGYRPSEFQAALSLSALSSATTWTSMPNSRTLSIPLGALVYGSNTIFVKFRFADGAVSPVSAVAVGYGIRTPPVVTATASTNIGSNAANTFALSTTFPFGYWQTNASQSFLSFSTSTNVTLPILSLNFTNTIYYYGFDGTLNTSATNSVQAINVLPWTIAHSGAPQTNFATNAPTTYTLTTTYPVGFFKTNNGPWVSFVSNTNFTIAIASTNTTNTLAYYGSDGAFITSGTNSNTVVTLIAGVQSYTLVLNGGNPSATTNVPVTLSALNADRVRLATNAASLSGPFAPYVAATNWVYGATGSTNGVWLVAEFSNSLFGFVATCSNVLLPAAPAGYTFDNTPVILSTNVTVTLASGTNAQFFGYRVNGGLPSFNTNTTNLAVLTNGGFGGGTGVATNVVVLVASNGWGLTQTNARLLAPWMLLSSTNSIWSNWARFSTLSVNGKLYGFSGQVNGIDTNVLWSTADGVNWSAEASSPWVRRQRPQIQFLGGYYWAQGGFTGNGFDGNIHKTTDFTNWVYVQSNSGGAFSRLTEGFVTLNNKTYSILGQTGMSSGTNDVWSTSDGTTWNLVTSATPFPWRENARALAFNNNLWLVGGATNNRTNYLNEVWSSPDGSNWTQAPTPPWSTRGSMGLLAYSNRMWVFGGITNQSGFRVNDVWSTTDGSTWVGHSNANWMSREDMGVGVLSNRMVIWGGDNNVGGETWWAP